MSLCAVSGFKRRLLDPKNTLPRNLEVIEIICKVQHLCYYITLEISICLLYFFVGFQAS